MNAIMYLTGAIAVLCTAMAISRTNAVHALLYLIVSLLAVAIVIFLSGAPFAAALEAIIYAGAIMVLFVFVIMILNMGSEAEEQEKAWLGPLNWIGPTVLAALLLGELIFIFTTHRGGISGIGMVDSKQVGFALFGPYFLGVELASLLLLAGLVGAYHLGRKDNKERKVREGKT